MELSALSNKELVKTYSNIIIELRNRGIIRTGNVTGELGEYLAIEFYNSNPGLPNLQAAPIGTENIDAISRKGERYTVKTITQNTTGSFYGLNEPGAGNDDKVFEYVIIVQLSREYELVRIVELSWNVFQKHKHWHKRNKQWNLSITKDLLKDSKIVYDIFSTNDESS